MRRSALAPGVRSDRPAGPWRDRGSLLEEGLQQPRARLPAPLGMELHAEIITPAHRGGDRRAIIRRGDAVRTIVAGEAMREIDIVAVAKPGLGDTNGKLAPDHIRHRPPARRRKRADLTRHHTEAGKAFLLGNIDP